VAGLARWRRGNRRHAEEVAHTQAWLAVAEKALETGDAALATEVLRCRQLIKGYSDTHTRGTGKFDRLMYAVPQLSGQPEAAARLASLRAAAALDPKGKALGSASLSSACERRCPRSHRAHKAACLVTPR
jgi:indolepyruvate ferredoxin oxidoreductase beta subunit